MRKNQMFQKPHFKGDDFPTPRLLTIAGVRSVEVFIPNAGAKEQRWVVKVKEDARYIFLSETLFDHITAALGNDDTDNWADKQVEFYRDRVNVQGKARWGVRARAATQKTAPLPARPAQAGPARKTPAPITDVAPKRPYSPQTLLAGFALQRDPMPAGWKAAVLPSGVRIRVCIGFKEMFPNFSADEVASARHSISKYLCEGRYRVAAEADNALSWADGKVFCKWLFTGERTPEGHDVPCPLAASEGHTMLAFLGFFDDKAHEDDTEDDPEAEQEAAEEFVDEAVKEAVEMLGATVTETAPPPEEGEDDIPL